MLFRDDADGCESGTTANEQCSTGDHWHVPAGTTQGFGWSYGGHYIIVVDSIGSGGPFSMICTGTQDPDIP